MADRDDDPIDALHEAIEKAGLRINGGVRVSPKQRRNLAINRAHDANSRLGYSMHRGPKLGSGRPGKGFKSPSGYSYNGRSRALREATAAGRAKGALREDRQWSRDRRDSAKEQIHFYRLRRGEASPYKRGFGGNLKRIKKAKAKTLYVFRKVENASDIIAWAKAQGFPSTLAPDDLHVTIAFSKSPLNWAKLGDDWCAEDPRPNDNGERRYAEAVSWSDGGHKQRRVEGGAREVKALGDKSAVVLAFQSPSLTERWAQFLRIGASWDYAGYTPHITITYKGKGVDLAKVEPYKGPIILGEEDWNEIEEGAGDDVAEVAADVSKSLDDLSARIAAAEAQLKAKEAA